MDNDKLTNDEEEAVNQFVYRLGCENAFGDGITVTEEEAIKFLMARKFDVGRAISLFHTNRMLRGKFELEDMHPDSEPLASELQSGKFTVSSGKGPEGDTLCIFFARKHFPKKVDHVTVLRSIVFQLDYTMELPEAQRQGLSLIYDMTQSSYANFDFDLAMKVLHLLKGGYPARLKHVYILAAPFWFRASMTILSSFLRDKIRDRVEVVKTFQELWEKIPAKYLPIELGGVFEHDHSNWLRKCTEHVNAHGSTISLIDGDDIPLSQEENHIGNHVSQQRGGQGVDDDGTIFENAEYHPTDPPFAEPISAPPSAATTTDEPPPLPSRPPPPPMLDSPTPSPPMQRKEPSAPIRALPPEPVQSDEDEDKQEGNASEESSIGRQPMTLDELLAYMKRIGKKGIKGEYEEMRSLAPAGTFESTMYPVNTKKNRYNNILTFEETRVKLNKIADDPFSDYINANYVNGFEEEKKFICTQGPTPNTFFDFWRMVWEQNVGVIVMVTRCFERNRNKCGNYWPQVVGEVKQLAYFAVEQIEQNVDRDYTILKLHVNNLETNVKRTVYHIQFTSWPDFGVLSSGYPLLNVIDLIDMYNRETSEERRNESSVNEFSQQQEEEQQEDLEGSGEYATLDTTDVNYDQSPVVVHCSAGVGRTGTFCCVSNSVERLEKTGRIDIFSTVKSIREQRAFSVQTPEQYQFCYTAVIEHIIRLKHEKNEDIRDISERLNDFLHREVSSDSE